MNLESKEVREIHLFRPFFRVDEVLEEIRECLDVGWTGIGFKTRLIEEQWREFSGLPNALFVNSATAGLHLAVRVLKEVDGWQEGDEVITTPFTFVSTNHPLLWERLTPVFADIDRHLCLDPDAVEARVSPRTRAVIFVGIGGNVGQLGKIVELCRRHGLRLILDGAHMSGTYLRGLHVGNESDAAVFSFQAVKNLPTADAGMVCFREREWDELGRKLSWLGIDKDTYARTLEGGTRPWFYEVEHAGFKYNGNSLMAAVALVGLRYLEADNQRRRELCLLYERMLRDDPRFGLIPIPEECVPSRHLFQVLVADRDAVMGELRREKIYAGVHYRDNTEFRPYRGVSAPCPRARWASEHVISLPLHLLLSEEDVQRVGETLKRVCTKDIWSILPWREE